MKKIYLLISIPVYLSCLSLLFSCGNKELETNLSKALVTKDVIYSRYSVAGTTLLRETYPFNDQYVATYLAEETPGDKPNAYAYLWPFSGSLSAWTALLEVTGDKKYAVPVMHQVIPALEEYYDTKRTPAAYASYINDAPVSDRFYDDNIWIGIDFTELYMLTNDLFFLERAKMLWKFIESGTDDKLGGGIYWCEQQKKGKNTCSNAPGSVYALKLFEATGDSTYFYQGENLYKWTKTNLQDPDDFLYYDHISLSGRIGKTKYAYNSGQMVQAACLLYKLTADPAYLSDARNTASACYDYFFEDFTPPSGESFRLLKKGDVWFASIMLRGIIELYSIDKDPAFLSNFNRNLQYAWENARDQNGLFDTDWSGKITEESKWLLTQTAMVEMYARMSQIYEQ